MLGPMSAGLWLRKSCPLKQQSACLPAAKEARPEAKEANLEAKGATPEVKVGAKTEARPASKPGAAAAAIPRLSMAADELLDEAEGLPASPLSPRQKGSSLKRQRKTLPGSPDRLVGEPSSTGKAEAAGEPSSPAAGAGKQKGHSAPGERAASPAPEQLPGPPPRAESGSPAGKRRRSSGVKQEHSPVVGRKRSRSGSLNRDGLRARSGDR